jgi:hypothetical protein
MLVNFKLGGSLEFESPSAANCVVTTTIEGITIKATTTGDSQMAYTLPVDKQVHVAVQWLDRAGHPAPVDGPVTWATSDATIADVTEGTDTSTAVIVPGVNLGTAQISATADADLGAGITNVICVLDVDVVAGQAVSGTISPTGPAEPIP